MSNLQGGLRCFHTDITCAKDAEDLLRKFGRPWSFLLRPSHNSPGHYTIDIRKKDPDDFVHVTVLNKGDYYQTLGPVDSPGFASLSDLVSHYMDPDKCLKQRNGTCLYMTYPLNSADPVNERWFHGRLSTKEAETLLKKNGKSGSYLVRESKRSPGSYAISCLYENKITHFLINYSLETEKYFFQDNDATFETLGSAVTALISNNTKYTQTGDVVYFKDPLNTSTILNAINLRTRVTQLMGEEHVPDDQKGVIVEAGFLKEFQELQKVDPKGADQQEARADYNKQKNRYKNILPYDSNRIRLQDSDPNIPGSDYINASPIKPTDKVVSHTDYIACQGCLSHTVPDFWQMVWQEKVSVILMVTNEVEGGKNKCVRYWPEYGKPIAYPIRKDLLLTVILRNEEQMQDYTLRTFQLNIQGQPNVRLLYHYQFKTWPDHGVPNNPGVILDMIESANRKLATCDGPLLVHCSAGIGRTGTLIAIDSLINRIKLLGLDCDLDIQRTLYDLRAQRPGMVQTAHQYKFIYMALQDYIDSEVKRHEALNGNGNTGECEYANLATVGGGTFQMAPPQSTPTPAARSKSKS